MKLLRILPLILATTLAYGGTVSGVLQGPSGIPVKNATLGFTLQQAGLIVGTGSVVPLTVNCFTSSDGSVVGIPNLLSNVSSSTNYGSGTLPAGIYYVKLTFYSGTQETLPSPELRIQLTSPGTLNVSPPASFPSSATGIRVYIGTVSGGETLQGSTTSPTAQYSQSTPLTSGAALPVTNSSICSIAFNDTIIPYTGYNVNLTSSTGNAYPGWPQAWQLNGGTAGTVNISQGAPLWNGTVIYPQPILAQPLNHGPQSISGPLNLTGYNLNNAGAIGVGTNTPSWPIDVENGLINSSQGYLYNGGAGTSGQCLVSNGTAFIPGGCTSAGTIYYQSDFANGTSVAQRLGTNFLVPLVLSDNGFTTGVGLSTTAVTPGSYTNASVTFDQWGRATAASSGPALLATQAKVITTGICSTTSGAGNTCGPMGPYTWPVAFADNAYALTCSIPLPSASSTPTAQIYFASKTASGFSLYLQTGQGNGAQITTVTEIDCVGVHP